MLWDIDWIRLGNEITRLTAVHAIHNIANSKLHPDLTPILSEALQSLSSFLRQVIIFKALVKTFSLQLCIFLTHLDQPPTQTIFSIYSRSFSEELRSR